mgnify:CR=1 FL=1
MYKNLETEMKKRNITNLDLAHTLNVSPKTVSFKLNGKARFNVDEMWLIKKNYFEDLSLEYIFEYC